MQHQALDADAIGGYHAHVYYGPETRAEATQLRDAIGARFATRLGRWHDAPIGPHPISMYQVAFETAELPLLLPWLMLNHGALSILVHPLTGDDYEDHAQFGLWLGTPVKLRLEVLSRRK